MIKQNKGFLLLEVLLTVVLVSASVVFINHAFSSSLKAMSLTNSYREAIIFLDDKVFDIELNMYLTELSSFSKEETFSNTLFLWEQEVLPFEKKDLNDDYDIDMLGIERLFFSVGWEKNGMRNIELYTYIPIIESAGK
ncbi:MAG: hypothetical protein D4S01_02775 [Dehalococcoidia bacterium]|nr:MAG: hypothetical protein D4S01_02775 [Dehalococcoidia bacterium]